MKQVIKQIGFTMIIGLATYFAFFSNNNGLSNIGMFALYLECIIIILVTSSIKKKKVPNHISFGQYVIISKFIVVALIALYFNDFIIGSLFVLNTILCIHIVKNN